MDGSFERGKMNGRGSLVGMRMMRQVKGASEDDRSMIPPIAIPFRNYLLSMLAISDDALTMHDMIE